MQPLSEDEIRALPLRELAFRLLERMDTLWPSDAANQVGRVIESLPAPPGTLHRSWTSEPELARLLAEAWDWLYVNGLTAGEPSRPTTRFVTRAGKAILADPTRLPQ